MKRTVFAYRERYDSNVENSKRRRALSPFGAFDVDSRLFFERILMVRKAKELIFVSAARAKNR